MNLITQVKPISLGRWLCEVFIIGGRRIAYVETPKDVVHTRASAIDVAEVMAHLCSFFRPGKYNIYPNQKQMSWPFFVAETNEQPELERIGEANLPRQEGE